MKKQAELTLILMVLFCGSHLVRAEENWFTPEKKAEQPKSLKTAKVKKISKGDRSPAGERNKKVTNAGPAAVKPSQSDAPVLEAPEGEDARILGGMGFRKKASDWGLDFDLTFRGDFFRSFSGGTLNESLYLGEVDFKTNLNLEKMFGSKGTSMFIYLMNTHGRRPSLLVGDLQGTDSIETPMPGTKLYEAWIQQLIFDDKVSLLFGLHDLNSEFYVTDASGLFLNASFGVGKELSQTGVNGPSIFPTTAVAGRVRVEPSKNFYMQFGVFDAQSGVPGNSGTTYFRMNGNDGQLLITEFAVFNHKDDPSGAYGKFGLGFWNYTRTFTHQVTGTESSNSGTYFIGEQAVSKKATLFLKHGLASGEVNRVKSCTTGGVVFTGLIPSRAADRFGLGLAHAINSDQYISSQNTAGEDPYGSETTYEMDYRFELMNGIALQPDLQYVVHPGTSRKLKDAGVGSLRIELKF